MAAATASIRELPRERERERERRLLSKGGQMVIALPARARSSVTMLIEHPYSCDRRYFVFALNMLLILLSLVDALISRVLRFCCASLNHPNEVISALHLSHFIIMLTFPPPVPDSVSQCQLHYPRRSFDERAVGRSPGRQRSPQGRSTPSPPPSSPPARPTPAAAGAGAVCGTWNCAHNATHEKRRSRQDRRGREDGGAKILAYLVKCIRKIDIKSKFRIWIELSQIMKYSSVADQRRNYKRRCN